MNLRFDDALRRGLALGFLLSFLYLAVTLVVDGLRGGHGWRQGDWLINTTQVMVRRGGPGDVFLWLGDLLGVSPLWLVVATQILALGALYVAFWRLARGVDVRVAAALAISPAMFAIFWAADPQGAMRKDLIGFLAVSVLALGVVERRNVLIVLGFAIYAASVFAHEAMALFLPTILGLAYLARRAGIARGLVPAGAVFAGAVTIAAVWFALGHAQVTDPDLICAPLIARGLDVEICEGAILWLQYDLPEMVAYVRTETSGLAVWTFLLAYLLALVPLAITDAHLYHPLRRQLLLVLTGLPFITLYVVAADWGRWISFHVFSYVVLTLVGLRTRRFRVVARLRPGLLVGLLALALVVSPSHMIGLEFGGVLRRVVHVVAQLFS